MRSARARARARRCGGTLLAVGMLCAAWPRWAVAAAAGGATPATETGAASQLARSYARYVAEGRSDVEIHLADGGGPPQARLHLGADGVARCLVSGLRLAMPSVLVHEATHCLVAPHLGPLATGRIDAAGLAADRLLHLASEGTCDARALLEVFRADGPEAAALLHEHLRAVRLRPSSPVHDTATALALAWQRVREAPASVADGEEALAAALEIGSAAALPTLRRQLAAADRPELADAPEVHRMHAALRAAGAQVLRAWRDGQRANAVFTWVPPAAAGAATPGKGIAAAAAAAADPGVR